jgi:hypothetical protein
MKNIVPQRPKAAFCALALVAAACTGSIIGDGAPGPTPGSVGGAGTGGASRGGPETPGVTGGGPAPAGAVSGGGPSGSAPATVAAACPSKGAVLGPRVRRIAPEEYTAAVKSLLYGRGADGALPAGVQSPLQALTDPVDRYPRFASIATVGDASATDVILTARLIGDAYAKKLEAAPGSCLKTGAITDCARTVVRGAAEILFGRPLDADQEQAYVKLAEGAAAEKGATGAVALAVGAMLASPDFIFHVEFGRGPALAGAPASLDGYEMAGAIASLLGSAVPDEALWQAAKSGQLATPEQIRPHVARLLGDYAKAPPVLMQFVRDLFGYTHVRDVFKDAKFHDPSGLIRDTDALVAQLLDKNGHSGFFEALLTTPTVLASASTAQSYGLAANALTGKDPRPIDGMSRRAGLLTQPSFLAGNSVSKATAPVKRGAFVRKELLCQPIPPVPIGVVPVLPDKPLTAREKLALHGQPDCIACHRLMDPPGLALEIFDDLGRYRTLDQGKQIDATGVLEGAGDQDGTFKDGLELIDRLGRSSAVKQCFARQLFRWAAARGEQDGDACSIARVTEAYMKSNGDVTEAIVAALSAESFRARNAAK